MVYGCESVFEYPHNQLRRGQIPDNSLNYNTGRTTLPYNFGHRDMHFTTQVKLPFYLLTKYAYRLIF